MYYLRTANVFPVKKEKPVETAVAIAGDVHQLHAVAPSAHIRSILSAVQRDQLSARQTQLQSKLWSRKRRRKLTALVDHRRVAQLLRQLQHQQHHRSAGSRCASTLPRPHESAEERQPAGDAVRRYRRRLVGRFRRQTFASISANRLRAGAASAHSRRRAASHRLPLMAMERSVRCQRHQADTEVPQRQGSDLRLLQSRSLESTLSTR